MKTGLQYAKRNLWEDAKISWEQVLEDVSPIGVKDRISAMYNLGVYHEIKDDLDKALSLVRDSNAIKKSRELSLGIMIELVIWFPLTKMS